MADYTDSQLKALIDTQVMRVTNLSNTVLASIKSLNDAVTVLQQQNAAQQTQINALIAGDEIDPPPVPNPTPTPPTGLTATAKSATSVELKWTAPTVGVAIGYQILRGATVLTTTPTAALTYTDGTATGASTYTYAVRAVLAGNVLTSASNEVSVTTPPATTTPPPSGAVSRAKPFTGRWKTETPATLNSDSGKTNAFRSFNSTTWLNCEQYSVPVYEAKSTDPLVTITPDWGRPVIQARIPAGSVPAAGTDGNMCIIQPDGTTVDTWTCKWTGATTMSAGRVVKTSLSGTGFGPWAGIRAAGCSTLGGLIQESDIVAGKIEHALAVATPSNMMYWDKVSHFNDYQADGYGTVKGYVAPATEQDYDSEWTYKGVVPMGSRLAIPRSVTIPSDLNPAEKMVAVAMQNYGAYILDTTGQTGPVTWYAETSVNKNQNAWLTQVYGRDWGCQGLKWIRANTIVVA